MPWLFHITRVLAHSGFTYYLYTLIDPIVGAFAFYVLIQLEGIYLVLRHSQKRALMQDGINAKVHEAFTHFQNQITQLRGKL